MGPVESKYFVVVGRWGIKELHRPCMNFCFVQLLIYFIYFPFSLVKTNKQTNKKTNKQAQAYAMLKSSPCSNKPIFKIGLQFPIIVKRYPTLIFKNCILMFFQFHNLIAVFNIKYWIVPYKCIVLSAWFE